MPVAEKIDKFGRHLMDIESVLFTQNRMVFIDDVIDDALAAMYAGRKLRTEAWGYWADQIGKLERL